MRASGTAPHEIMDLVVLAVKAADVKAGARQALPMLGVVTPVLTIQNGLGSAETVAGVVGEQRAPKSRWRRELRAVPDRVRGQ